MNREVPVTPSKRRSSPISYAEAILKGLGSLTAQESSEIILGPLPTADVSSEVSFERLSSEFPPSYTPKPEPSVGRSSPKTPNVQDFLPSSNHLEGFGHISPISFKSDDLQPRYPHLKEDFGGRFSPMSPEFSRDNDLPSRNVQLKNEFTGGFRPFSPDISTKIKNLELHNARLAGRLSENDRLSAIFRGDCHRFMQESRDYHRETIRETKMEYKRATLQLMEDVEEQRRINKEQRMRESLCLQSLKVMANSVPGNTNLAPGPSNNNRTIARDVIDMARPHSGNHILIVTSKDGGSAEENRKVIFESINIYEKSIRVNKVRMRSNGKIMIEVGTTRDKDNLYRALTSTKVIRDKFDVTVAKKRKPYFIILNVDPVLDIHDVKKALVNQNDHLTDDNISVKFSLPGRRGTNWVVAVEPSIFAILDKSRGVYLGWNYSRVSEYINVWQCFNCGKYGHTTKECLGDKICLKCSKEYGHEGNCKLKCLNCSFSNHYHNTTHNIYHSCIDRKCPNYIRQMGFVVRETDYGIQF